MANLHFRLTTLELDEEEDVTSVVAVVDGPTYDGIRAEVGDVEVLADGRGGTEKRVRLTLPQMRRLYTAARKVAPAQADRYRGLGAGDMYDSLGSVFNAWMEG